VAELSNERYADMLGYTRQLGSYDSEDLLAAGFSPDEVSEFEAISTVLRARSEAPPPQSETFVQADEPTLRESSAATLAELFGGGDYDRGDLLLARKFTGTSDPTATFADSMGLADLVGLGAVYGTEEGAETMVQGARSGDLGTVALGAAETGLSVLEAVPGAAFVTKAGGKLVDDVLDASRRAEADRFFLERQADAEGYSGAGMEGERVFVPTEDELAMMRGNPTPNEQVYLDNLEVSRQMQDDGATADEIFASTGFLNLPVSGPLGQPIGVREVYAGGQDFAPLPGEQALRDSENLPDIKYVPQKDLPSRRTMGEYDADTKTIRVSEELDMVDSAQTMEHELAHFDHGEALSDLDQLSEAGSDPKFEQRLLRDKIDELKTILKDPALKDQHASAKAVLDDIRKSESAFVNYANNPGEILARAASGESVGYELARPRELLNPYINTGSRSNTARGLDALLMKLRPDLALPDILRPRDFSPPAVEVPMDVRRGQVNDPRYKFSPRP